MAGEIDRSQFFPTMRRRNLKQIFLHLHLNENLFEISFLCTINAFTHLFTSRTPNESINGKFVAIASNSSPDIEPSLFVSYILKTAFNGTISTACQQKQLEKRKQQNFKSAWPSHLQSRLSSSPALTVNWSYLGLFSLQLNSRMRSSINQDT